MDNLDRIISVLTTDDSEFKRCFWNWINVNRYYDEEEPKDWCEFSDKTALIIHVDNNELL